jgi:hypothetical protein
MAGDGRFVPDFHAMEGANASIRGMAGFIENP